MSYNESVSEHYTHGALLEAIQSALAEQGKNINSITVADLAPVDEFHIGGRLATDHILAQLSFDESNNILDVGCGLGGASRYIASQLGSNVSGIDLTQEYIDVGNAMSKWLGLDKKVSLSQGSALAMPFEDDEFDGAIMLHVGMNIEEKAQLFAEVFRVLSAESVFAVYDVMRIAEGDLEYPVPWASEEHTSKLASPSDYQQLLAEVGFEPKAANVRRDFALEFFKAQREKTAANGGPPPLGLHTIMQESAPKKFANLVNNIVSGLIAPVEIIAYKP